MDCQTKGATRSHPFRWLTLASTKSNQTVSSWLTSNVQEDKGTKPDARVKLNTKDAVINPHARHAGLAR